MKEYRDHNELIYAVASFVKEHGNLSLPLLRARMPGTGTPEQAQREYRYNSRGSLLEDLILEEFIEEFPKEFQDD